MEASVIAKNRAPLVFLWLALFSVQAFAEIDNSGVLDNVLTHYANAASTWGNYITNRASWLFWTLTIISMIFTFGFLGLRKADLGEFYAEFVRFTIFTGFFWWLLMNGPTFATAIMDSLRRIGAEASGLPNALAPSGIVDIGFGIFSKVVDLSSVWSPVDSTIGLIIALLILAAFALVGVNMLLLLISGWMLAYAGIFFLGFGGSRWTSEMAIGYYKTVLNIAVQLCVMILIVGIGKSICDQYYANMNAGITLKEMGVMFVVAIVLVGLVNKVPGLIGSIAGGHTGALGSGFGAGAVMGAATLTGAAMSVAGQAILSAGANMAGGAQAVMAAFSKANAAEGAGLSDNSLMSAAGSFTGGENGAGTSPLAAAMGGTASDFTSQASSNGGAGTAESYRASSHQNSGARSEPESETEGARSSVAPGEVPRSSTLKSVGAMAAKVGRVGAGTASNLSVGTYDVAKAKLGEMMANAVERIGQTPGGKIAAAINARAEQDKVSMFGADSLSASPAEPADRESEVAAFRDKSS